MAPRVRIMTDDGIKEYPVYADNRELARDFKSGHVWPGVEVIYRSMVCEIICDFVDDDRECFLELLFRNGLMNNISFTVCG